MFSTCLRTALRAAAVAAVYGLLAGCGGGDGPGAFSGGEIEFGIWVLDEDGAPRFRATADVPNEEDQAYGWRVRIAESEQSVKWIESITLPVAPDTWEGVEDDPSIEISPDGRAATTVGVVVPDGGYLENAWFVSAGDPPGEYEMTVELSDGRQGSFSFRLGPAAEPEMDGTVEGSI